jgi:tetratricopeptide (TPR) repeat protein
MSTLHTPIPNNVDFDAILKNAHAQHVAGNPLKAAEGYQEILKYFPNHFDSIHLLGVASMQLGRPQDALALYDRALNLNPQYAPLYLNRGNVFQTLGHHEEAVTNYQKAIELNPEYADAYSNLGNNLRSLGRHEEALLQYEHALRFKPNDAGFLCNKGNALYELKRVDEALAAYEQSIKIKPDYPQAISNRGIVLSYLTRYNEAIECYDQALAIDPKHVEAYSNKGNTLQLLGRYREALGCYEQALAIKPTYADADYNAGICLLTLGEFNEGWKRYESRWKIYNFAKDLPLFSQPLWKGEPLQGKSLLIQMEQGLGDGIQFSRYATLVAQQGALVLLHCPPDLAPLLKQIEGVHAVFGYGDVVPSTDYYCTSVSLPYILKTELHNIPAHIPYLFSQPERVAAWETKLGPKTKPRIGFVWSGNLIYRNDQHRSIPLIQFNELRSDHLDFFCLQKELRESDQAVLAQRTDIQHFENELTDFNETAALIELMDMVVTVDTSIAHLAAAMGKPVWIFLRHFPDWRWLLDREDSPWYPTVRLFRQTKMGEWDDVIKRVKKELFARFNIPE